MSEVALQPLGLALRMRSLCICSSQRTAMPRRNLSNYTRCIPSTTTRSTPYIQLKPTPPSKRTFTSSTRRNDWLQPKHAEKSKSRVGRPRMPTGGSMRGTTVVWGDYGLRMKDHDRRVSAKQLRIGEQTIRGRLRGMRYQLFTRVSANIGVYTKGNEVRMGKGKGKFDYWAARIPVSRIVFELKGNVHEQVVKDAFRLAGHKLPGMWEFVRRGDPPMVGITKLQDGVTLESLKLARRPVEPKDVAGEGALQQVIPPASTTEAPQTVSTSL